MNIFLDDEQAMIENLFLFFFIFTRSIRDKDKTRNSRDLITEQTNTRRQKAFVRNHSFGFAGKSNDELSDRYQTL